MIWELDTYQDKWLLYQHIDPVNLLWKDVYRNVVVHTGEEAMKHISDILELSSNIVSHNRFSPYIILDE